jgi:hypothetical protein
VALVGDGTESVVMREMKREAVAQHHCPNVQ